MADNQTNLGEAPGNNAKTTMLLMLRAFQSANCHIPDGERRERFEAMLKHQGIDDIDTLMGEFIELMNAIH